MSIYEIDHDTFNWILLIFCGLAIPVVFGLKMLAEYVAAKMISRREREKR